MLRLHLLFFFTGLLAVPAFSDSFTFNNGGGNLGTTSKTFTIGSTSFTATLFNGGNLYEKCCGANEIGLGANNDPSGAHELWHKTSGATQDFIQLNLTNLINAGYAGFGFILSSVQSGESGHISECASASSGTDCGTNATIDLAHPLVDFSATAGNVLLNGMTFTAAPRSLTPVPEPSGILLLGSVLAGVAVALKRYLLS